MKVLRTCKGSIYTNCHGPEVALDTDVSALRSSKTCFLVALRFFLLFTHFHQVYQSTFWLDY